MKKAFHASCRCLMTILAVLLFLPGTGCTTAETTTSGDVAIRGYDPVAYFRAGEARKGSDSYSYQWHDLTWHFVSAENRALFQSDPQRYAPQYDGYCAWAMTEGRLAKTDPEVWKIVNGKLYLNCSRDAYDKWSRDIPGNIEKADSNWEKLNRRT